MNLKSQIFSYSLINVLNASIPFILLPILTTYLSPSDYGTLSLFQLLMLISTPIILMNTQGLLTIEYSKLSFTEFQNLVSSMVVISIFGFLFLEVLFFIFERYILYYFHVPQEYLYFIPFFILLQAIPIIVPIIFQAKKEPINFGKYKISMSIVNISLTLLFVLVFSYGWEGRLFGIVGAFGLFTLIGFIILIKLNLLKLSICIVSIKKSLAFGVPLIPHSIAGVFLIMSDRVFLGNMLSESSVGIYSVSFQIASVITILFGSINQAWAPNLFEKLNQNPSMLEKKEIVKTTYKIMLLMIGITVASLFILPYIFDIFIDESYSEGKYIIDYIVIAFLFQGFYYMVTNYIFYSKKNYLLSYITFSMLILVFISNFILIGLYGIIGAAYAMLIIWILFFFVTWIVSNRVYPMPWRLK